jgi:hypothetical protein
MVLYKYKITQRGWSAYIEYDKNRVLIYKSYWLRGCKLTEKDWFNQLSAENKLIYLFGTEDD